MKNDKKDTNNKSNKEPSYRPPGFFNFIYKYISKNKSRQNPEEKNQNIIQKIGSAIDEYKGLKENHRKNISTYEVIFESSKLSFEYFILLTGSCVIAAFGLLQNSTAVVIGAMIIAPLMTPILGFALGSLWGDQKLIGQSFLTLLTGSGGAICLSAIIGFIIPGIEMNDEILARTNPTLYDIIIALASGFIGSYAFINQRISSSISGVAIAVALIPPLAVTGICIGTSEWQSAIGSFLLFASNLVSISLAASFVFWRMKVQPYLQDASEVTNRAKRKILFSSILLILISIPLGFFMRESLYKKKQIIKIESKIKKEMPYEEISTKLYKYLDTYHVECKIISSSETDLELKNKIQNDVIKLFDSPVKVKLIIIKSI